MELGITAPGPTQSITGTFFLEAIDFASSAGSINWLLVQFSGFCAGTLSHDAISNNVMDKQTLKSFFIIPEVTELKREAKKMLT